DDSRIRTRPHCRDGVLPARRGFPAWNSDMIRLLLADDHAIVRAGLRALLDAAVDIAVVGDVADADAAVSFCAATPVDLVLMDLRFGDGRSGASATASL